MKKSPINVSLIKRASTSLQNYVRKVEDENKQKFIGYLYISLTLFTVSFFGIFAIKPTLDTVSNLNKQYEDDKLVYDALKNKLSALQSLDAQYQTLQQDLELVFAAIPKSNKIPYLARQIEKISLSRSVLLTKLDFGPVELYPVAKTNPPTYSFTFNVNVEGDESNTNLFISDLINFDRIIGLERITTGKSGNNGTGVNIAGRAFFSTQ